MFSPIFCTSFWRSASTLSPPLLRFQRAATSAGFSLATSSATALANCAKSGFFATKSVSAFTSTMAPSLASGESQVATAPSAATREAALEALAPLLMRSSSSAFTMSPPASSRAFLHSIMPSPVRSRSSLTIAAVISAISISICHPRPGGDPDWIPVYAGMTFFSYEKGASRPFFRGLAAQCLGAGVPLLLFRVLDFDEVLGALRRHHLVHDLAAALEDRVRHATRVEADGAGRVVVAGDHVVDAVQRVVRVDHADDGDAQRLGLADRDPV